MTLLTIRLVGACVSLLALLSNIQDLLADPLFLQGAPLLIAYAVGIYASSKCTFNIFKVFSTSEERQQHLAFEICNSAQALFYLLTAVIAGLAITNGEASKATAVSSWLLLFIIDDFIIISDYRRVFGNYASLLHRLRFPLSNAVLFVVNILIMHDTPLHWVFAVAAVQALLLLLSSNRVAISFFKE